VTVKVTLVTIEVEAQAGAHILEHFTAVFLSPPSVPAHFRGSGARCQDPAGAHFKGSSDIPALTGGSVVLSQGPSIF
jgi:hypothetical protein